MQHDKDKNIWFMFTFLRQVHLFYGLSPVKQPWNMGKFGQYQ